MKYLAAYALLVLGGKAQPTKADVEKVLSEVGAEVDNAQLDSLFNCIGGKPFHELVAGGMDKLAALPAAGAVAVEATTAGEKNEEAAEEEPEKKDEEEDVQVAGLFDDDEDDY